MVLITGSTGFLGFNLVRTLLKKGEKIRVILRDLNKEVLFKDLENSENLEILSGDIINLESLEKAFIGIQTVYHSAATVSSWPGLKAQAFATNVTGTKNVIEACERCKVETLVYFSSADALGIDKNTGYGTEATPWNYKELGILNSYSETKFLAHEYIRTHQFKVKIITLCPVFMIGPYDLQLSSNRLVLLIASGKLKIATAGGNSFIHVQDVVDWSIKLSQLAKDKAVYILGSENLSYTKFFEKVFQSANKPPKFVTFPKWLALFASYFGSFYGWITQKEPDLHIHTIKISNFMHFYSYEKIKQEFGFSPRSLETALKDSIDHLKSTGRLH